MASLAVLVLGAPGHGAAAVNVESVVMPGSVIKGHAKLEADCDHCHVRFDRPAQARLCLACHDHRDVASDVRNRRGYHGRIKETQCRACHTDHKGRDARIVVLDEQQFDHGLTDFPLRGKHVGVRCTQCHRPNIKRRNAPSECNGCHRKDDKHAGQLDRQCQNCHNERDWRETIFEHDRSRFPLLGKHKQAECRKCHATLAYKDAKRDCASCHDKDDIHKGQLGAQCDKCHDATSWKASGFEHARDARFPLRGRHRDAKCESCHKSRGFGDKPPTRCATCHERDDLEKGHKGRYGDKCESCHSALAWKPSTFDHERDSRYALRGKHATTKCEECHRRPLSEEKPLARCFACHERSDKHNGQLDKECQNCHNERTWRETSFEHVRARFPLLGKHKQVDCRKCHATLAYRDAKLDCASCHAKDDLHKGRFVPQCELCHDAQGWKTITYDHERRARFKLEGKHGRISCYTCHKSPLRDSREAPVDCKSCHKDEDVHFDTYGPQCQRCHEPEDWRKIVKRGPAQPVRPQPKPSGGPR